VTVISTISTQPPMIADELRRQADVFTDIVTLQGKIGRDPSERPARAPRDERGGDPGQHPAFLQRPPAAPPRAGAPAVAGGLEEDDESYE
jgi:hypothetical protein